MKNPEQQPNFEEILFGVDKKEIQEVRKEAPTKPETPISMTKFETDERKPLPEERIKCSYCEDVGSCTYCARGQEEIKKLSKKTKPDFSSKKLHTKTFR